MCVERAHHTAPTPRLTLNLTLTLTRSAAKEAARRDKREYRALALRSGGAGATSDGGASDGGDSSDGDADLSLRRASRRGAVALSLAAAEAAGSSSAWHHATAYEVEGALSADEGISRSRVSRLIAITPTPRPQPHTSPSPNPDPNPNLYRRVTAEELRAGVRRPMRVAVQVAHLATALLKAARLSLEDSSATDATTAAATPQQVKDTPLLLPFSGGLPFVFSRAPPLW